MEGSWGLQNIHGPYLGAPDPQELEALRDISECRLNNQRTQGKHKERRGGFDENVIVRLIERGRGTLTSLSQRAI